MKSKQTPLVFIPVYITCSSCEGSGMSINYYYDGSPEMCSSCKGSGVERVRDSRGRFVGNKGSL